MSPALVAATMAAGDLALMALEVPTGWFADRFGYRRSLILGSLLQVAGMICCWLAEGIPGLVGACLLVAVADAFRWSRSVAALPYLRSDRPRIGLPEDRGTCARRSGRRPRALDRRRRRHRHKVGLHCRVARGDAPVRVGRRDRFRDDGAAGV